MRKKYLIILLWVILLGCSSNFLYAQPCGQGGNGTGTQGSGGGIGDLLEDFFEWVVRRVHSADPNDILGPGGYGDKRWVAAKDRLSYRIRFENNHEIATAPAQNIFIRQPIDPGININSLRLGSFGFGFFTFNVPPNTSLYTARLDVKDSLGVLVDVIAGIDIVKHELFWTLKSIDPATGRAPENPLIGILQVNDTTITRFNDTLPNRGEGFVTYEINTKNTIRTGDTVAAKAIIVFDTNEEIATNTWVNSIDAGYPASRALTATSSRDTMTITWTGQDDAGGTGIKEYALYVSENGGPFTMYKSKIQGTSVSFTGIGGNSYGFFTIATDQVGNTEPLKSIAEASIELIVCREEICNGADDDCDGLVDEGFTFTYYPDADKDGFGALTGAVQGTICNHPAGYVRDSTDCDDNNRDIYPGAPELCDNLDNNCNGQTDENVQTLTWYRDADGDGFGGRSDSIQDCKRPPGYELNHTDCNDQNAAVYPGAVEICDGLDNNCDGNIDEGFQLTAPSANAASAITITGFQANWNSVSNATGYYLDVSGAPDFSSFINGYNNFDAGNSISAIVSGLACDSVYYYRIRAYNGCGIISGNSGTISVSTASCASCAAPTVQASALVQEITGATSMTLSFTKGNGARRMIKINTTDSFTDPVDGTEYTAGANYSGSGEQVIWLSDSSKAEVTGLTSGTSYCFRIYEMNCTGSSTVYQLATATGNSACFTTAAACSEPTVQAAISSIVPAPTEMTLNLSPGNGVRRIVKINTTSAFTDPQNGTDPAANTTYAGANEQVVYNGNGSSVVVQGLIAGTNYCFRVYEANCIGGQSVYTVTGSSTCQNTTAPTAVPSIDGLEEFKILPNPNNGIFIIQMKFNTRKEVSFSLSNTQGQVVYESGKYNFSGSQTKEINVSKLAAGIYMLETKIGNQKFVEKIVISR